jgi:hypothetical protein
VGDVPWCRVSTPRASASGSNWPPCLAELVLSENENVRALTHCGKPSDALDAGTLYKLWSSAAWIYSIPHFHDLHLGEPRPGKGKSLRLAPLQVQDSVLQHASAEENSHTCGSCVPHLQRPQRQQTTSSSSVPWGEASGTRSASKSQMGLMSVSCTPMLLLLPFPERQHPPLASCAVGASGNTEMCQTNLFASPLENVQGQKTLVACSATTGFRAWFRTWAPARFNPSPPPLSANYTTVLVNLDMWYVPGHVLRLT